MAETFHEDMLAHLAVEQRVVNARINAVHEIIKHGSRYRTAELATLIASTKESGCAVCTEYLGNPEPED